jgi:hypothetical protein
MDEVLENIAIKKLAMLKDDEYERAILLGFVLVNISGSESKNETLMPISITPEISVEAERQRFSGSFSQADS